MFSKAFGGKKSSKEVETSLIEQFWYPKYGPGQLWEIATDRAIERGAKLEEDIDMIIKEQKDDCKFDIKQTQIVMQQVQ